MCIRVSLAPPCDKIVVERPRDVDVDVERKLPNIARCSLVRDRTIKINDVIILVVDLFWKQVG